jgi:aminomethyltransferase
MKKTAFNSRHHQLGARMVEFAGYEMPVEYTGVNTEHLAVRKSAGLFDVSHMGEIWVQGSKARQLLDFILSNDAGPLTSGRAQYSCLPNGKGGIVDDLIVHKFNDEKYLLVVNAANTQKDWEWIKQQNVFGADLNNASEQFSQLALQGPEAATILQKLTSADVSLIRNFGFIRAEVSGLKDVIIAATGYTGSGGFELYTDHTEPVKLWDSIMEAGNEFGLRPIGLAARDTLRLEMGYCLYGNDIDATTSPIEAGLGWITKFNKGRTFIDRDFLFNQQQNGVRRKLVGFEMKERGIPRQHYFLFNKTGERIGEVTSGTMSPSLQKGIGLAYVKSGYDDPGHKVLVGIREKMLNAEITRLPFYKLH